MMLISRLFIYPVKSCAGIEVDTLNFDGSGPENDRRFVVTTPEGDFLTQRQHPVMAHILPELSSDTLTLHFDGQKGPSVPQCPGGEHRRVRIWGDEVHGIDCGDEVAQWLSDRLGITCRLMALPEDNRRCADSDYAPADTGVGYADGFPLLVITEESLEKLSEEAGLTVEAERFRPNVVLSGAPYAFAECNWTALTPLSADRAVIGELLLVKPCERCVIPTRDPGTLERTPAVIKALKALCLMNKRIVFGQNAVYRGAPLERGASVQVLSE